MSTIQIDFHQPAQFGLSYADASGGRAEPVLVHRSLAGSMERLFAVLGPDSRTPDLAAFGKALGNGMPISALVGKAEYMDRLEDVYVKAMAS